MYQYYLLDHEYLVDETTLHASMGHLLAFNPHDRDASLRLTFYYADREPTTCEQQAPAGKSTESNYTNWPVEPNTHFAVMVESDLPIVCQSTIGWNNSGNDYNTQARTHSPHGVRECAKSYMAISQLHQEWYLADGLVIDNPNAYVRESEWAILFNPSQTPAEVQLTLYYNDIVEQQVSIPAQRCCRIRMDDRVRVNKHYGIRISSDQPIAAQWLRTVKWSDDSELMAYWSVPCVAGPLG